MSKAKELARGVIEEFEYTCDDPFIWLKKLANAVLSEPEPLRGWIEVTDVCDSCPMLINLNHIEYVSPDGVMYSANEGEFTLKESYEVIKQKIARAG